LSEQLQMSKIFVKDVTLYNEMGERTDKYSKLNERGDAVSRKSSEGGKSAIR
jgi:hypothetical protein